jgi:hypothetical protein
MAAARMRAARAAAARGFRGVAAAREADAEDETAAPVE